MPELPEVETIRRQLAERLPGRRIVDAWCSDNPKFTAAVDAIGARIGAVERRGKYLAMSLDDDRELVIHLGMTGVVRLRAGDAADAYIRAAWTLDDRAVLELRDVRQFGRVAVVKAGDYTSLPTLHSLGPDPFDDSLTPAQLRLSLNRGRAAVKAKLLSQRAVAGVGNIYADEALWRAQVSPAARRVTRAQAERLLAALREVLAQAIDNRGTTLRDYRTFDGESGRNQFALACYGRAGEPCQRCSAVLARRAIAGRTTTYCPTCQRR